MAEKTNILFPLQQIAVDRIEEDHAAGYHHVCVSLPTGFGKTIIAAYLSARLVRSTRHPRNVMFVAHRDKLLVQTVEKFRYILKRMGLDPEIVGLVESEEEAAQYQIAVVSIQKAHKWSAETLERFEYLFTDECHRAYARTYRRLYAQMTVAHGKNWFGCGLSATIMRSNPDEALGDIFEKISYQADLPTMIEHGYLCSLRLTQLLLAKIDTSKIKTKHNDYDPDDLSRLLDTKEFNQGVATETVSRHPKSKCIVFAINIKHAHHVAEEFTKQGVNAVAISGETPRKKLNDIYQRFDATAKNKDIKAKDRIQVLVSCDLLLEGFDSVKVSVVVWARPTQSQINFIQGNGRGLRNDPEDPEKCCQVLDYTDNSGRMGIMYTPRLESYNEMIELRARKAGPGNSKESKHSKRRPIEEGQLDEKFVPDGTGSFVIKAMETVDDFEITNTKHAWEPILGLSVLGLGIEEGSLIIYRDEHSHYYTYIMQPKQSPELIAGPVDKHFGEMVGHQKACELNTKFSLKDRTWRQLEPTDGQIKLMTRLDYKGSKTIQRRGQASDFIAAHLFLAFLRRSEPEQRQA